MITALICNKLHWLINSKLLLFVYIVAYKEGKPDDRELDEMAGKICSKWQELGLRLDISQDKLDEIDANEKRKAYRMLLHWRNTTASTTLYRDLYYALCHHRVGLNNVAKEFCGKVTTWRILLQYDYLNPVGEMKTKAEDRVSSQPTRQYF